MDFTKLVDRLCEYLTLKNYSERTIATYRSIILKFLHHFDKEPIRINQTEINAYFIEIKNPSTYKQTKGAVKWFYDVVIKQPRKFDQLPARKMERKLPAIFSKEEIQKLIFSIENIKHRAIISTIYSLGLRISEPLNIEIKDIDSIRMMVHIRAAKGKKDRYVPLPENLLHLLRKYYSKYRPQKYLFEYKNNEQYSDSSIRAVFHRACGVAGITKNVRVHSLRHSFATHHIESGTDISILKNLLGHNNIKTTLLYLSLSSAFISSVKSPASDMKL